MSDYYYDAVPPGGYWEPGDDRIDQAKVEDENKSWADRAIEAAIDEALLRRAERRGK
jgi:hypothetical protein